jgi:hypothetical protein
MSKQPSNTSVELRDIIPAQTDPIRIVPLHVPSPTFQATADVPPTPAPQLTFRGGPLLANVQIYTIFWGAAWQGAQSALANQLNDFFKFIVKSPLIDQLAEYNVPHQAIGHGSFAGTITIPTPAPGRTVTDTAIRHFLQQEISTNHAIPQPNPNLLYFVYLPPGVAVIQGGSRSCQAFCGYHDAINGRIFYAPMPYPNCAGCLGGMTPLDALTGTSSHELCEAITDAVPGSGWYDDHNGEIGDICAWKFKKLGPWNVQLEWSNKQNKCV